MVNAITTNLTAFFREIHHFEFLAKDVLPELARSAPLGGRRLRLWSAGCSSGEEPYSIAMTVRDALGADSRWDVKILATDIDTQMVATAEAGRYPIARAATIPPAMERQFVQQVDDEEVVMSAKLKSMIVFNPLNLFHSWPMRGPFDAIFCRNVIIYFDADSKRALIDRFAEILAPGGWLFIGHSESLFQVTTRFRQVGKTIHQRTS
jgi:chemotaxis protein methyltransferase CheR